MTWLLLAIGIYLAACLGLCLYILGKLVLGRRMDILVGPAPLDVRLPPFRMVAPRHTQPVDRHDISRRLRQAA